MTIRNLDRLFRPSSVALIGASRTPHSIGQVVARNLLRAGLPGPVLPVNPHERAIEGVLSYRSVADLPLVPDLAVIATPPATIPGLIAQLGERGTRAAVVISAGFAEIGAAGRALQEQMLQAAKPHLLRVIGPNCLGVLVPRWGLDASFAPVPAKSGDLALIAQSGAVVTSVLDWAAPRGIGFSHVVSLGAMADVDFGDLLDYMAQDAGTRAILLYIEALTHARKFMSAARAAARQKPVIVLKAGRSPEAAKAVSSHTGALAGSDDVYDAAFRRAGMLRVQALDELFAAVETLATGIKVTGDRLAILTNGGGIGVMAADGLLAGGGRLAELSADTVARLDSVLPATWSRANPIDIIGDAPGARYRDALEPVLADPAADAVLVMNCPTAIADSSEAAAAVLEVKGKAVKPMMTCWLGDTGAVASRRLFAQHRIPTYDTPEQAVSAFLHLVRYRRSQDQLMQTPPSLPDFETDSEAARAPIRRALAEGREWLSAAEAKQVLGAYGIPVVETATAATPAEAQAAAQHLVPAGGRVALKILSPDITHKSDVGGVKLDLEPATVAEAAEAMRRAIAAKVPGARLDGFMVEAMAARPGAHELIVGMAEDRLFGPVLMFGAGGTAVEVLADRALALPPLNLPLAEDCMARTRIHRLLRGYRDRPAADLGGIAQTLVKVSQLVVDLPEVSELDINPLLADADGVLAVDARIRVAAPRSEQPRLAIRPYPRDLEDRVAIADGRRFRIRPIRPEDETLLQEMARRQTPDDLRLRFFICIRELSHGMAARLTQIDYDREMALVALAENPDGGADEMCGVVRINADPDNETAEYAVAVRSDLKGKGLGWLLMQRIIAYAKSRGIQEIYGEVLRENTSMLSMCKELGFSIMESAENPVAVEVRYRLAG
jgi:acetyltransferase